MTLNNPRAELHDPTRPQKSNRSIRYGGADYRWLSPGESLCEGDIKIDYYGNLISVPRNLLGQPAMGVETYARPLSPEPQPGMDQYTDLPVREFLTGATRNTDVAKIDPEGFTHPVVFRAFCEYMHEHRLQADGKLRDSDNWQKGIPKDAYMKSLLRHVLDLWEIHRGGSPISPETGKPVTVKDAACAIRFNADGYLFEDLKEHGAIKTDR